MVLYGGFKIYGILRRFRNLWHFVEVLKPMVFYGGFWNSWYFTEVLKSMVFNGGFEWLFLRFKKTSGNTLPRDDLAGETTTWVNDLMEVLTLVNVKINSC